MEGEKSAKGIKTKTGRGKRVIRQLNSEIWSDRITTTTKYVIPRSTVEWILTCGFEAWELNKRDKDGEGEVDSPAEKNNRCNPDKQLI